MNIYIIGFTYVPKVKGRLCLHFFRFSIVPFDWSFTSVCLKRPVEPFPFPIWSEYQSESKLILSRSAYVVHRGSNMAFIFCFLTNTCHWPVDVLLLRLVDLICWEVFWRWYHLLHSINWLIGLVSCFCRDPETERNVVNFCPRVIGQDVLFCIHN